MGDQVSHPCKTTDKITILYVLMFWVFETGGQKTPNWMLQTFLCRKKKKWRISIRIRGERRQRRWRVWSSCDVSWSVESFNTIKQRFSFKVFSPEAPSFITGDWTNTQRVQFARAVMLRVWNDRDKWSVLACYFLLHHSELLTWNST
jgi:hypothetical protein